MKKIIYIITVVLSVFVASCSNDDIEIKTTAPLHSLTFNVSPQPVYDEFDVTNDVREIMRDADYALGITTYLYDSKGALVGENTKTQYNYNTVSEIFSDLVEGHYTLVTIETLLDPDAAMESPAWSFINTSRLSTLAIQQDVHEVYYPFVIGVATTEVVVDGDKTINVTPKAIGSLVRMYAINFDKSSYVEVGWGTDDVIKSYKLDPSLSRQDRYETDLTASGYTNIRAEREISGSNSVIMDRYVLESSVTYTFYFKKAEDAGTGSWTYYESNSGFATLADGKYYYAGFCFTSETTSGLTFWGDNLDNFRTWYNNAISQSSTSSLIPDALYMDWGGSVSSVQTAMSNYTLITGSSGRAVSQSDGSYLLEYSGKGKESKIMYYFTSATTGLFEADVQYDKESIGLNDILAILNSSYRFVLEDSGTYVYMSSDNSTYVMLFEINNVWNLGFVDVAYLNNSSVKAYMPVKKLAKNLIGSEKVNSQAGTKTLQQDQHIKRILFKKDMNTVR